MTTSCEHKSRYWEPLTASGFGPIRLSFASVPVCATCRRVVGDTKVAITPEAKKAAKEFSGTSWALMTQVHPEPPFAFVRSKSGLLPEGYKPAQAEMDDEVPF